MTQPSHRAKSSSCDPTVTDNAHNQDDNGGHNAHNQDDKGKPMNAEQTVRNYVTPQDIDPSVYLLAIEQVTGVKAEDILSRNRSTPIPSARHLYWACLRKFGNWSYLRIGDFTGYNHTSIISGVRNVPDEVVEAVGELA